MYFTVQDVDFDNIRGVGFGNGLCTFGLRRAPLNFTMKKKHPRNIPWGEDPGKDLAVEVAPLNLMILDLSVR
jgi:hypothetical protein